MFGETLVCPDCGEPLVRSGVGEPFVCTHGHGEVRTPAHQVAAGRHNPAPEFRPRTQTQAMAVAR